MGASAVLTFVLPASPLAQPWPVIGGHLASAIVGLMCQTLLGPAWFTTALAVGAAMSLLRSLHPPAGGTVLLTTLPSPAIAALGWPLYQR
ncbi:HPP family protein [Novosphingobium sp.]|uniref:HPP family protein n=1 Tax=Novosphingobium sp. TaxID=1874826 RepID=UPI0025DAD2F7|nr:HPP family protein [Novosphingobium sp.]MCC6927189.1 HPP family protein [Novosphingobium sp.]